jgi:hypothetical protein
MAVKKAVPAKKAPAPNKAAKKAVPAVRKTRVAKKVVPAKKTAPAKKSATTKVAASKRPAAKGVAKKGDVFECGVCGLAVVVDEACGCEEFDIICCEEPMKERKSRAKSKAAVA